MRKPSSTPVDVAESCEWFGATPGTSAQTIFMMVCDTAYRALKGFEFERRLYEAGSAAPVFLFMNLNKAKLAKMKMAGTLIPVNHSLAANQSMIFDPTAP